MEHIFKDTGSSEGTSADAIAPADFHKSSKTNDVNQQFLKSFNELKDVLILRDNDPKSHQKENSESVNQDGTKEDEKIGRFLKYLSVLLADFNSSELDDVQFEIIRVVREMKKELTK